MVVVKKSGLRDMLKGKEPFGWGHVGRLAALSALPASYFLAMPLSRRSIDTAGIPKITGTAKAKKLRESITKIPHVVIPKGPTGFALRPSTVRGWDEWIGEEPEEAAKVDPDIVEAIRKARRKKLIKGALRKGLIALGTHGQIAPVLAHEAGHIGRPRNRAVNISRGLGLLPMVAAGLIGGVGAKMYPEYAMPIGLGAGGLGALSLAPLLYDEIMASKRGMKRMRKAKLSEQELREAKKRLTYAGGTYGINMLSALLAGPFGAVIGKELAGK